MPDLGQPRLESLNSTASSLRIVICSGDAPICSTIVLMAMPVGVLADASTALLFTGSAEVLLEQAQSRAVSPIINSILCMCQDYALCCSYATQWAPCVLALLVLVVASKGLHYEPSDLGSYL
jgi:hypothetical protein